MEDHPKHQVPYLEVHDSLLSAEGSEVPTPQTLNPTDPKPSKEASVLLRSVLSTNIGALIIRIGFGGVVIVYL